MKKTAAERYRDIDFSGAKRGPAVRPEPGKTKISIRLDNTILDYFRGVVDKAGGGNYQTLLETEPVTATVDHADIRGLATTLLVSVAAPASL